MEINLELLQQLPVAEAEDGLCTMTCTYSCMSSGTVVEPCDVTGFIT
ncbi:MAG TPA: hypothetical protein VFU36_04835 [Jatrophihabitans sp.]|nr:hypothetical protein [Jatrophihabitans sp.]